MSAKQTNGGANGLANGLAHTNGHGTNGHDGHIARPHPQVSFASTSMSS
jgi:hypothetical protein